MVKNISFNFTVILLVLLSSALLYLPFILKLPTWFGISIPSSDTSYIYKNYDGPLYIIPAKTLYDIDQIKKLAVTLVSNPAYFAAHLPLYPLAIATFAVVMGFMKAMVFVTLLSTVGLALMFYHFLKKFKLTEHPELLVTVFLFLPRFFVVRSVGSPESLFLLLVLASVFYFERKSYWVAGLFGGFAVMTKSPGILLFLAYGLVFLESFYKTRKMNWNWVGISLIPGGLLAVFTLYGIQMHDFFAYFHSGDNIHLVSPYAVFNFEKVWVGTAWLEEVVFYFFMYALTVVTLKDSPHRSFFYFSLVFLTATLFVQHRDIARYSLPLWPFACIAFERFFTSKKFLIAFLIILPAIYLYAFNFILYNIAPIADWKPYM